MDRRPWKIAGQTVDLRERGLIMGVLNVTPDSFSDGGECFATDQAVERGLQMVSDGARIIDVGGESTRPGSEPVTTEEELRRVIPVIERLRGRLDAFVSVDTMKSEVAAAALDAGAVMVNDVSGGRADKDMMSLVAKREAAYIIMHMQGTPATMQVNPQYGDVVAEVGDFFRQQYACALECGIDPMAIAFDPGIGFGKTLAHNLELLRHLGQLRVHNRPLVAGVSRKAFLGKIVGSDKMSARLAPTVALTAWLRGEGADVFRVHDVKENVAALRTAEAILAL